jgi:hypothetical protein
VLNPKVQRVQAERMLYDFAVPATVGAWLCTSDATVGGTACALPRPPSARFSLLRMQAFHRPRSPRSPRAVRTPRTDSHSRGL